MTTQANQTTTTEHTSEPQRAKRPAKVRFDMSAWNRSPLHRGAPRGRGSWAFMMGALDYEDAADPRVWFAPGGLTYREAKQLAAAEAAKRGVTLVGVLP